MAGGGGDHDEGTQAQHVDGAEFSDGGALANTLIE